MNVLVTGGTGYIGAHTCVELLSAGHEVVILDNLSNSRAEVAERISQITGKRPILVKGDIRDTERLDGLFSRHAIQAVMHFAGLKSVSASVSDPLAYYDNNVRGSLQLVQAMRRHGIRSLVFSSSATVYGDPAHLPVTEEAPLQPTNPYGQTKLMVERMLHDLAASDPDWHIVILRYFNPVGAHESGLIGEQPSGVPNNLMPYIAQVASGQREYLSIFGNDYPTPDGTGIRDYIHVVDLAQGHLKALDYLSTHAGSEVFNLGTGQGYSVLEMVKAFEKASGRNVPYRIAPRRPGDVAESYADTHKANAKLNWVASRGIAEMCADTWRWQAHDTD